MHRKNKTLALTLLILTCLFFGSVAGACSSSVAKKSNANVVASEDGGEEEVLDPDGHDDFAEADSDEENDGEKSGGGILVSVTYLVMMLGSAALPFLVLL